MASIMTCKDANASLRSRPSVVLLLHVTTTLRRRVSHLPDQGRGTGGAGRRRSARRRAARNRRPQPVAWPLPPGGRRRGTLRTRA